jgi:hypothetical protein
MKTIAYFDCPSGISGDMCLGALMDVGVPLDYLCHHLGHLGINAEFTLTARDTTKQGQRAMQAEVTLLQAGHDHRHEGHHAPARHLPTIEQLITQASLPQQVKDWSLAIFRRLGEAEAAVHGIPMDQVHFHEVGATDAIVDIVGTCLGLNYLKIDTVLCSPLPTGRGRVFTAHGWLPVPAPAVLKLMEMTQVPLYSNGLTGELVTPTGAAIVTTLAQKFGEPPPMTLHKVGLGAGRRDLPVANILRLWVGQGQGQETHPTNPPQEAEPATPPSPRGEPSVEGVHGALAASLPPVRTGEESGTAPGDLVWSHDDAPPAQEDGEDYANGAAQATVVVLETQVDDLIPQAVGHLYDQLLEAGALDVFTQPVAMKKCRPGLLITVLCLPQHQAECETILFTETTTLGIRHRQQPRTTLRRRFETVNTPYGQVAIKLAYHPHHQHLLNVQPEYEDCLALARSHQRPWQEVYQAALVAWRGQQPVS